MESGQVNLSTEHQYWRIIRDMVEPAVRSLADGEYSNSDIAISRDSLVLKPGADYYSFDISVRRVACWRINYMLDCDAELVRMEGIRPDYPYAEPVVLGQRGVDDFSMETAAADVRAAIEKIRAMGVAGREVGL